MRAKGLGLGMAGVLVSLATLPSYAAQDAYQKEYTRAIKGVVANIQSNGSVVASPSQTNPNYYFDWIRDTSLTMKAVVALAFDPATAPALRSDLNQRIDRWIDWELGLQTVPKLTDLGEPRFYLNGDANNEPWGRPQNDGPALRALTAMQVAHQWINDGKLSEVAKKLYRAEIPASTLVKRDLEYVAHHWSEPSFDLWEEEKGMHFYTLTAQKVALLKGAELANRLNDSAAATYYASQATAIGEYLEQFYDAASGTLRYAIDSHKLPQKTTDLDISVVLAAIQTFDGQFYVPVDPLKRTVDALIAKFNLTYSINQVRAGNGMDLGPALGRYPGDVYSGVDFSGGNPWFLSTLAIAEFYCDLDKVQNRASALAQFNRVLYHLNANGDLSEQFNRTHGYEQGAHDLTWSYTAYVTAYRACF